MAFKQYTKCIAPENFSAANIGLTPAVWGASAAIVGVAFALAAGKPWCLLAVVPLTVFAGIVGFCRWWLDERLICLGGDRSAAGMLISIESPHDKSGLGAFDTDYSINLLLFENSIGVSQEDASASSPYGLLIDHQTQIDDIGLETPGYASRTNADEDQSAVLHAEFEGAGMQRMLEGAEISLWLSFAAFALCVVLPEPWGAIFSIVIILLALLLFLFKSILGLDETGDPANVNPDLRDPTLTVNSEERDGLGASLVYIVGAWVYDSMHGGWNEIHPIKVAMELGKWDGVWPADFADRVANAEEGINDALKPDTIERQKEPMYSWVLHPLLDGCDDSNLF